MIDVSNQELYGSNYTTRSVCRSCKEYIEVPGVHCCPKCGEYPKEAHQSSMTYLEVGRWLMVPYKKFLWLTLRKEVWVPKHEEKARHQ